MPFESAETSQPGVAQLVARVVWDHQVGGSSPSTRTKSSLKSAISESFSYSLSIAAQGVRGNSQF